MAAEVMVEAGRAAGATTAAATVEVEKAEDTTAVEGTAGVTTAVEATGRVAMGAKAVTEVAALMVGAVLDWVAVVVATAAARVAAGGEVVLAVAGREAEARVGGLGVVARVEAPTAEAELVEATVAVARAVAPEAAGVAAAATAVAASDTVATPVAVSREVAAQVASVARKSSRRRRAQGTSCTPGPRPGWSACSHTLRSACAACSPPRRRQ